MRASMKVSNKVAKEFFSNCPTTLNESFILPNGVVVLVDEDFDAYLDGTLVFIYPNIE